MDFLSPPTDNLYKFSCILFLIAVIYFQYSNVQLNTEIRKSNIEFVYQNAHDSSLDAQFLNLYKLEKNEDKKAAILREEAEMTAKSVARMSADKLRSEYHKKDRIFNTAARRLFSGLCLISLVLWYYRVQKLADIKIEEELQAKGIDIVKEKKSLSRTINLIVAIMVLFIIGALDWLSQWLPNPFLK